MMKKLLKYSTKAVKAMAKKLLAEDCAVKDRQAAAKMLTELQEDAVFFCSGMENLGKFIEQRKLGGSGCYSDAPADQFYDKDSVRRWEIHGFVYAPVDLEKEEILDEFYLCMAEKQCIYRGIMKENDQQ